MRWKVFLLVFLMGTMCLIAYEYASTDDTRPSSVDFPASEIDNTYPATVLNPPIHAMLFDLLSSLSAVIPLPFEIIASIGLWSYLGYRRVFRKNTLENENRLKIYETIKNQPGMPVSAISQETGLNSGTVQYHLKILQVTGKVISHRERGLKRYYRNVGGIPPGMNNNENHLDNNTEKAIVNLLIRNPGLSRKDIATMIDISGPSVTWHMARLNKAHLVRIEKDGRYRRYYINPREDEVVLDEPLTGAMKTSSCEIMS